MENGEKYQGSCGKRKKEGQFEEEGTGTLSQTGDMGTNWGQAAKISQSNTDDKICKFTSEKQRLNRRQLEKMNEIALKYNRRTFSETLDLVLSCYDFLEEIAFRYNLHGVGTAMDFVEKHLPQNPVQLIADRVIELLEGIGINGKDRAILEKELVSLLVKIKVDKKPAREVLRPLFVVR